MRTYYFITKSPLQKKNNKKVNIYLKNKPNKFINFISAFKQAVNEIKELQLQANVEVYAHLNTVVTDGTQLMATRYTTDINNKLSLYYTIGHHINSNKNEPVMQFDEDNPSAVLVASEPLGDYAEDWRAVPINHAIIVNNKLELSLEEINVP